MASQDPKGSSNKCRGLLQCSSSQRYLIFFSIAVVKFLVYTVFLIEFAIDNKGKLSPIANEDVPERCLTSECSIAANRILSSANFTIDPCDDFYKFACDSFLKSAKVPKGKRFIRVSSQIVTDLLSALQKILSEDPNIDNFHYMRLPKTFYKVCMNTELIERAGAKPMLDILNTIGGWPVVRENNTLPSELNWLNTMIKLRQFGYRSSALLTISVSLAQQSDDRYYIELNPPEKLIDVGPKINRKLNDISVQVYVNFILDVAKMFGTESTDAIKTEIEKVVLFELSIVEMEEKRAFVDNFLTIKELQDFAKFTNWLDLINNFLPDTVNVTEKETVNLLNAEYLQKLDALLSNTPNEVVHNFLVWHAIEESLWHLSKQFQERIDRFESYFEPYDEKKPLWRRCVDFARYNIPRAVSSLYTRRHVPKELKGNVQEIVSRIKKSLRVSVQSNDWLDEEAKKKALLKLQLIQESIAYPSEILNESTLEKYYQRLRLNSNDYFSAVLNIKKFNYDKELERLRQKPDKTDHLKFKTVPVSDAFYWQTNNAFCLPAGILQEPYYGDDQADYINYGGIGAVIGHELSRSFSALGKFTDERGRRIEWWTSKTEAAYEKHVQCITNQYNKFTEPETQKRVDGEITLDENMADTLGVAAAYMAYSVLLSSTGPMEKSPKLNYTDKQLFWLSYGQSMCTKYDQGVLPTLMDVDHYSVAQFRVNGPLQNNPFFAEDFNCSVYSYMNPKEKCLFV